MKKVSIKDIANHLGVSVPTVSLVLNGRGDEKRISQETQQKIIKYAKEKNYKPNIFAKGLKKGRSEMIGLIIPNIADVFYARIASQIEKEAAKQGYTLIYSSSEESAERERELINSMLDRQVEGLIIASSQKNIDDILKLQKIKFPFVLIDRHYPELATNAVIVDNKGGIRAAINHLIQNNASKIGYVSLKPTLDPIIKRIEGYKEALEAGGIHLNPDYIQELDLEFYEEQMSNVFEYFLSLDDPPDAVVFSTHYLAVSGLRELKARGLSVPGDIKIVSYGDFGAFDLFEPPITRVRQPAQVMGEKAVKVLLDEIKCDNTEKTKLVLDTSFLIGKSCGE